MALSHGKSGHWTKAHPGHKKPFAWRTNAREDRIDVAFAVPEERVVWMRPLCDGVLPETNKRVRAEALDKHIQRHNKGVARARLQRMRQEHDRESVQAASRKRAAAMRRRNPLRRKFIGKHDAQEFDYIEEKGTTQRVFTCRNCRRMGRELYLETVKCTCMPVFVDKICRKVHGPGHSRGLRLLEPWPRHEAAVSQHHGQRRRRHARGRQPDAPGATQGVREGTKQTTMGKGTSRGRSSGQAKEEAVELRPGGNPDGQRAPAAGGLPHQRAKAVHLFFVPM